MTSSPLLFYKLSPLQSGKRESVVETSDDSDSQSSPLLHLEPIVLISPKKPFHLIVSVKLNLYFSQIEVKEGLNRGE